MDRQNRIKQAVEELRANGQIMEELTSRRGVPPGDDLLMRLAEVYVPALDSLEKKTFLDEVMKGEALPEEHLGGFGHGLNVTRQPSLDDFGRIAAQLVGVILDIWPDDAWRAARLRKLRAVLCDLLDPAEVSYRMGEITKNARQGVTAQALEVLQRHCPELTAEKQQLVASLVAEHCGAEAPPASEDGEPNGVRARRARRHTASNKASK